MKRIMPQFINYNLPKKVTGIYFEDVIAKFILFREAEKLYGIKPNNIGEMRNAVVPYAISLFGYLTDYKLNLEKIWKNQKISDELSAALYSLMKQLNEFILHNSQVPIILNGQKRRLLGNYKTTTMEY